MSDRTDSEKVQQEAATENEVLRAAREHRGRSRGVPEHGKPGGTPRKDRPTLRGAFAAAAIIEGRS